MSERISFETVLEKHEDSEATGIYIPFDVEEVFGAKRVPVKVLINGLPHRSTVVRMGGKYMMAVPRPVRELAKIKAGDTIKVEMWKDTEERTVEIPPDFKDILKKAGLADIFEKLSFTHRKEYVNTINDAKKIETRIRRIQKAVEEIEKKKK